MTLVVTDATWADHHNDLCKIARKDKNISSFSSNMFSTKEAYAKGWIRLAYDTNCPSVILGFTCVRHKVHSDETMLYFVMVAPEYRKSGVGELLMEDLYQNSPKSRIALKVKKDNRPAIALYQKHGFQTIEEAYGGTGWLMHKELKK